jgi:hypothetical protein
VFLDAAADAFDRGGYEVGRRPVRLGARDPEYEVPQDLATVPGMDNLWVELDPVQAADRIRDRCEGS